MLTVQSITLIDWNNHKVLIGSITDKDMAQQRKGTLVQKLGKKLKQNVMDSQRPVRSLIKTIRTQTNPIYNLITN